MIDLESCWTRKRCAFFFLNEEASYGASTFQRGTFHCSSDLLCSNAYSGDLEVLKLNPWQGPETVFSRNLFFFFFSAFPVSVRLFHFLGLLIFVTSTQSHRTRFGHSKPPVGHNICQFLLDLPPSPIVLMHIILSLLSSVEMNGMFVAACSLGTLGKGTDPK